MRFIFNNSCKLFAATSFLFPFDFIIGNRHSCRCHNCDKMLSKITQYAIRSNFFLVLCIFSRKYETNVLFYGIIEPITYMCASIKDKKRINGH